MLKLTPCCASRLAIHWWKPCCMWTFSSIPDVLSSPSLSTLLFPHNHNNLHIISLTISKVLKLHLSPPYPPLLFFSHKQNKILCYSREKRAVVNPACTNLQKKKPKKPFALSRGWIRYCSTKQYCRTHTRMCDLWSKIFSDCAVNVSKDLQIHYIYFFISILASQNPKRGIRSHLFALLLIWIQLF